MEKVVYCVGGATESGALPDALCSDVADRLLACGAHGVQVNVADDDVAAAEGLRIVSSSTPASAVVSVWVDSAVDHLRAPFDDVVSDLIESGAAESMAAYLVTESVPLRNTRYPAERGVRTAGMAQMAFLQRPAALGVDEWLEIWLNSHTQIAIETQDTFLYVQNIVTRVLTPGATRWHAIVEEGFPAEAMADPNAFFDAVGDDELLAQRQQEMFNSVQRFIDLETIEVIPTSRYVMQAVSG